MFEKDIKFPKGFACLPMTRGDYATIVSMENNAWEMKDLYMIIGAKDRESEYDAMICIGKNVDQVHGDEQEEIDTVKMFEKDIKFPEGFDYLPMTRGDYATIVSMENSDWGMKDLYILIGIKDHKSGYDAMICIGKNVDQVYGDKQEVIDTINNNICSFFRQRAKEKGLYYKY